MSGVVVLALGCTSGAEGRGAALADDRRRVDVRFSGGMSVTAPIGPGALFTHGGLAITNHGTSAVTLRDVEVEERTGDFEVVEIRAVTLTAENRSEAIPLGDFGFPATTAQTTRFAGTELLPAKRFDDSDQFYPQVVVLVGVRSAGPGAAGYGRLRITYATEDGEQEHVVDHGLTLCVAEVDPDITCNR